MTDKRTLYALTLEDPGEIGSVLLALNSVPSFELVTAHGEMGVIVGYGTDPTSLRALPRVASVEEVPDVDVGPPSQDPTW